LKLKNKHDILGKRSATNYINSDSKFRNVHCSTKTCDYVFDDKSN